MPTSYETVIELPYSMMVEVKKYAESTGKRPQEIIIQLLAIALSQESRTQSAIAKSLLDLRNDDD